MIDLNAIHNASLDYQVVSCDGELATIQVQVPVSFAATLPALLGSLQSTLALMSQRVRVANAVAKAADPVEIEKRKALALQKEKIVLARYDKLRAGCSTDREAIRKTRDYFKSSGMDVTSFVIEMIARSNGRFRKNNNGLILAHTQQSKNHTKTEPL